MAKLGRIPALLTASCVFVGLLTVCLSGWLLKFFAKDSIPFWAKLLPVALIFGGIFAHFFLRLLGAPAIAERFERGPEITDQTLDALDKRLGIKLPESYRALIKNYPWPVYRRKAGGPIWNHVDRIAELNEEYRGHVPGESLLPPNTFVLGQDETDIAYLLRIGDVPDAGAVGEYGEDFEPVAANLREFVTYYETEMRRLEINPLAKAPPDPTAWEELPGCLAPVIAAIILLWLVIGWPIWYVIRRFWFQIP